MLVLNMDMIKYQFEYPNGIKQDKYLISAEDWRTKVKPILEAIAEEKEKPEKKQSRDLLRRLNTDLENLIGKIDVHYELICEGGRHHGAIINNGILPPFFAQDIERQIKITEL